MGQVSESAVHRLARDRYEAGDHDGDWGDVGGERKAQLLDEARRELETQESRGPAPRGSFEVFHGEADRKIGESSGAVGWLWRFVDEEGHELAHDRDRAYETPQEAAAAVARFVLAVRAATYGLRFDAAISAEVRIVDA